jgi:alpha-glucoside transport system substrate-binding protein
MRSIMPRKLGTLAVGFAAGSLLLAACASGGDTADSTTSGSASGSTGSGKTLTIMTSNSGKDAAGYEAVLAAFTAKTGIKVEHEGTQEFESQIVARAEGGNPPDLAEFPQSGLLKDIDKINPMVDLSKVLDMTYMNSTYPTALFGQPTTDDGRLIGSPAGLAVQNSTIWYDPETWAEKGYTEPATWDELLALTEKMKNDGLAPWCVTIESGGATGWMAADWVMDMMLQKNGPEVYDQWMNGDIKNSDPRVKAAWEEVGKILNNEEYVFGGRNRILSTSWDQQSIPMFENPPKCGMSHIASFALSSMPEDVVADLDTKIGGFNFPKVDAAAQAGVVGNSAYIGVLVDSPEARELIKFLSSAEAFEPWIKASPYALTYNNKVSLDLYGSETQRELARDLGGRVPVVVENAVDSFPGAVAQAYWSNLAKWIEDGGANLDERLAAIDAAWQS